MADPKPVAVLRVHDVQVGDDMERHHDACAITAAAELPPGLYELVLRSPAQGGSTLVKTEPAERADFEKWAMDRGWDITPGGRYWFRNQELDAMFCGWLARAKQPEDLLRALVEGVRGTEPPASL